MPYLTSVLDVYELVLCKSPSYDDGATSKVKQEILHSLGKSLHCLERNLDHLRTFCWCSRH